MFYISFNARVWVLELISTTELICIYIFLNSRVQMSFEFLSAPEFRYSFISFNTRVQMSSDFFQRQRSDVFLILSTPERRCL